MGVVVEALRVKDEFRPLESVNWLLANIGEKITIELDIRVELFAIDKTDVQEITARPSSSIYTPDTTQVINSDTTIFADFSVGDEITITGTISNNGTYTIVEKFTDEQIKVDSVLVNENFPDGAYIYLSTPINGITYFYNFIENESGTNFNSLTTGELQRLTTNAADATDTVTQVPLGFEGRRDYRIGDATIVGRGISAGAQLFTITHNTVLTPLFLANQYDDLVSRVAPIYFVDGNALRYVASINAGRTLNDPNTVQTIQFDELEGNTGWFNENYNGGDTNYSLDTYTLERVSDSSTLAAIELAEETEAVISITNTTDTPFVNGSTQYTVNFAYLPDNEDFYQFTDTNLSQNFYFDRAFQTVGSAAVAGDNFGTDYQVIKETDATFVSSSQIDIRVRFDFATAAQSILSGRDNKRYMLWVTTQDHSIVRKDADKVALLIDVNELFIQLFQTDLISNTTKFIQHPFTDIADGVTTPEVFLVDDVVARGDFNIDFTDKEDDGIRINTISNQIVLKNATNPDIILENTTIDVSGSDLENGLVPFFDIDQDRIFKIPSDIRKVISLKRNESADAGNVYNWYSSYPFMHRWEYWESIGTLSFLPDGIFDTSEPLNGLNHNWHRYTTVAGWTINHRLKFSIEQNGEIFEQSFDSPYTSFNFNSNAQWGNESIDTFDVASGSPLSGGGSKLIQGYVDTKVVATFEKLTGDIPVIDDVEIVIWIEVKEQGGISDIRRISSVYETGTDSWFKSTDSSNKVVKNKVGSVYTGEALIDATKIPDEQEFTIYARLYDASVGTITDGKLLESGDLKLLENLDNKILE